MNHETLIPGAPCGGSCVTNSSKPPETTRSRRILVADDDEDIRHLISSALAGAGCGVNTVSDGEQAWQALCHAHYDLLVTDNEMPRLAGIKLVERIRKAGMSLPIIMASGTFPVERARNDPQLQIAAVIQKPFDILRFLDTVGQILQVSSEVALADQATFHPLHRSP